MHVALLLFVPGCVALTWWQVSRALGGNTLSWVYTFEWPIFGGYAVYMWWKLVHDEPVRAAPAPGEAGSEGPAPAATGVPSADDPSRTGPVPGAGAPTDEGPGAGPDSDEADQQDEELAAYNRYLAELNASGRQKRW